MKTILFALALTLTTAAGAQSVLLSCRNHDGSNVRQTMNSMTMEVMNPKGNAALQNRMGNLFPELRNSHSVKVSSIKLVTTGKNPTEGLLTVEAQDSMDVEGKIYKFQRNVSINDYTFTVGRLADKLSVRLTTTAVIIYEMTPMNLQATFSKTECLNP